jgi:capsule polysaccharide export protein KpsE/RkpR
MSFTTWDNLVSTLKDRLAELATDLSTLMTYEYADSDAISAKKRKIEEVTKLMDWAEAKKDQATGGHPSVTVSYGRHRRFQ